MSAGGPASAGAPIELLVVGGGPAGGTAGLYGARIGRRTAVLAGSPASSALSWVAQLENVPGFSGDGPSFLAALRRQAEEAGARWEETAAVAVACENRRFQVTDEQGRLWEAPALVMATGAEPVRPPLPGLERLFGRGVSSCAWCDGALFRDRDVAVLGGGNTAFAAARILSGLARSVTLLVPRRGTTAFAAFQRDVVARATVRVISGAEVKELRGESRLEAVVVRVDGQEWTLPVSGLFLALGQRPRSHLLASLLTLERDGFVPADAQGRTHRPGLFVAGDLMAGQFRQAVVACAGGANAILAAEQHLKVLG